MISSLMILFHAVRILGWSTGFRYWKLGRLCKKDPENYLTWAKGCRSYAQMLRAEATDETREADEKMAQICEDWAHQLYDFYAKAQREE